MSRIKSHIADAQRRVRIAQGIAQGVEYLLKVLGLSIIALTIMALVSAYAQAMPAWLPGSADVNQGMDTAENWAYYAAGVVSAFALWWGVSLVNRYWKPLLVVSAVLASIALLLIAL